MPSLQQCPSRARICPAHAPVVALGQRQGLALQSFHAALLVRPIGKTMASSGQRHPLMLQLSDGVLNVLSGPGQEASCNCADGGGALLGPQAEDLLPISTAALHRQLPKG